MVQKQAVRDLESDNDSADGTYPRYSESHPFRWSDVEAVDDFDYRPSIFERPVRGRFGRLYWLKIQLRLRAAIVGDIVAIITA